MDLGLPKHLVWRQPFPGPGLAIRILCARKPYLPENCDRIGKEIGDVVTAINSSVKSTLLPCRSVGVRGVRVRSARILIVSLKYFEEHCITQLYYCTLKNYDLYYSLMSSKVT